MHDRLSLGLKTHPRTCQGNACYFVLSNVLKRHLFGFASVIWQFSFHRFLNRKKLEKTEKNHTKL
jgi:hypothetical protein